LLAGVMTSVPIQQEVGLLHGNIVEEDHHRPYYCWLPARGGGRQVRMHLYSGTGCSGSMCHHQRGVEFPRGYSASYKGRMRGIVGIVVAMSSTVAWVEGWQSTAEDSLQLDRKGSCLQVLGCYPAAEVLRSLHTLLGDVEQRSRSHMMFEVGVPHTRLAYPTANYLGHARQQNNL
jgi:hypothetical protein